MNTYRGYNGKHYKTQKELDREAALLKAFIAIIGVVLIGVIL